LLKARHLMHKRLSIYEKLLKQYLVQAGDVG